MDTPRTLPRDQVIPWPDLNPRKRFGEEDLEELAASLREDGMLLPLGVKLNQEPPHYIFAGERRWRASEGILEEVPVTVRDIDEAVATRLALTENIQRSQLTPMEEAWGIARYMEKAEAAGEELTQTQVGEELGKSQGWVSNRLRLLRLPDEIQALVQAELVTATQARDLILCFSPLPDALWEELAGAVATRLVKMEKAGRKTLSDEDLRNEVRAVATAMSGFVDSPLWNGEPWLDQIPDRYHGRLHAYTWTKEQQKAAPRGVVIQYAYGYGNQQSKRCFDPELWVENVTARIEEAKAEAEAEEEEEAGTSKDLDWSADLGAIPSDTKLSWGRIHEVLVYSRDGEPHLRADPTVLEDEHLVVWEAGEGRDSWDPHPKILCTSWDAYQRAVESLKEKIDGMHDRLWQRAMEEERRTAPELDPKEELSVLVLAAGAKAGPRYDAPTLLGAVLADMEVAPGLPRDASAAVELLSGLDAEVRTEAFQRTMYRFIKEDLAPEERTHHEAREKVFKMLLVELAGRMEIPTPIEEEDDAEADS